MANKLLIRLDGTKVKAMPFIIACDYDNIIVTNPPVPYTATQDCYLAGYVHANSNNGSTCVSLDGGMLVNDYSGYDHNDSIPLTQVAKGQVVNVYGTALNYGASQVRLYGVKAGG